MQARISCDVISRSRNRLIDTFRDLAKGNRRTRKGMKGKRNRHGAVGKSSLEKQFRKSDGITFAV